MLRKLQKFMDTMPAMRKLHVNQKGFVYPFKVTIIIIKDMVTMKKVEDHSGTCFYKIFFYN